MLITRLFGGKPLPPDRCCSEGGSIVPENRSLVEQITKLPVPQGCLAVWALGQQGYLFKGGGRVIAIDPYLSNYVEELAPEPPGAFARQVPIVVQPDALGMVDLVFVTHAHADHCDPRTLLPLLQAAPQARLIASYRAKELLVGEGADAGRIEAPLVDRPVSYAEGLTVTAIPSAHYGFEPDAQGNPAYLGFIFNIGEVKLYHCGDSIVYSGLLERLKGEALDIACLPINGRDWFREQNDLVGNMNYREAADLSAAVGACVLLPGHNDMFAANSVNPAYLLDYLTTHHPRQRVHFLQAGELYYYVSDGARAGAENSFFGYL